MPDDDHARHVPLPRAGTPGPRPSSRPAVTGWRSTLLSNGVLPLILLLMIPLGMYIEQRGFDRYVARMIMLVGFNIILAVSLQLINGFSGQFSLGHAGFMAVGSYAAGYFALNTPGVPPNVAGPVMTVVAAIAIGLGVLATPAYFAFAVPRALRMLTGRAGAHRRPVVGALALAALLLVAVGWVYLLTQIPSLWEYLRTKPEQPVTLLARLVVAGLMAGLVGLLVGLPALRLRGDYLAIATLGFAEIIRIMIQNSQPLGAALGLTGIPKSTNFAWLYGTAVVTIVVCWRLAYSAKGRAIMAVREDEIAAQAVGVSPTHYKVVAFVAGAMFGGVAGALYALYERSITPEYFGLQKSIEIVVIVTLGGLGSISGAILAAIVLTLLPELLRSTPSLWPWGVLVTAVAVVLMALAAMFAGDRRAWLVRIGVLLAICVGWEAVRRLALRFDVDLAQFRMILYSLLLIGMMLLRPQGLLGGRELWPKRRGPAREAVATEDRDRHVEAVPV